MEIYLNVLPRPLPGHEEEFEELVDLLDAGRWGNPPQPHAYTMFKRSGFFGLWQKKEVFDIDAATARFEEISQSAGVTLNAPTVGRDAAADEWAQQAFRNGWLQAQSETDAVEHYKGLHVFDLLPTCDGFPVYSPSTYDKGFDLPTLNGTLIAAYNNDPLYSDDIEESLTTGLYGTLLATELAAWGVRLRKWADSYARTHGFEDVLGDRDFDLDAHTDPEICLHIIDQAARWAAFWSGRGHGAEPIFMPK
ncbi:MAG: hypothetical protein ABJ327_16880 [Litoreibacter sp.]